MEQGCYHPKLFILDIFKIFKKTRKMTISRDCWRVREKRSSTFDRRKLVEKSEVVRYAHHKKFAITYTTCDIYILGICEKDACRCSFLYKPAVKVWMKERGRSEFSDSDSRYLLLWVVVELVKHGLVRWIPVKITWNKLYEMIFNKQFFINKI